MSIKSYVKNKYTDFKTEAIQKSAANRAIKKKANVAYLQQREKEQITLAKQKATHERKQQYKNITSKKGSGFSDFFSSKGGKGTPDILGLGNQKKGKKDDIFNFRI